VLRSRIKHVPSVRQGRELPFDCGKRGSARQAKSEADCDQVACRLVYWRCRVCRPRSPRQGNLAVEVANEPWHAVRLHRGRLGRDGAQRARAPRPGRPRIMASKRASMRRNSSSRSGMKRLLRQARHRRVPACRLVPQQQRASGRQNHFKRTGDAGAVPGIKTRRARQDRAASVRHAMPRRVACEPRAHLVADLRRDRRHRGSPCVSALK